SQFVWDLATWNQFGDDLRGVDALAVVGNAGSYGSSPQAVLQQASDGIVSLTSGSLDFVKPGRTRIVNYCHVSLSGLDASLLGCTGGAIATLDAPSHPTYQIVCSFLADPSAWQTVGGSPSQDPYLSKYGGVIVPITGPIIQFTGGPTGVSFGETALSPG